MIEAKQKILIVEDDLDVADMLHAYFQVQGYDVFTVNWGEDGVRACQTSQPDLIILDIRLPDIDGFEVARRLRSTRKTQNIPIIFLTEKREKVDQLDGLAIGADDYITKPFDVQELRLRIRNSLRRAGQDSLTNPITGIPDGRLVDERLHECATKPGWAMLLIALENLDAFREAYGFVASDDVLRAVSLMIQNAIHDIGATEDFLGHIDATDFTLISSPTRVVDLQEHIRTRLEQSLDYFYPIKDREQPAMKGKHLAVRMGVLLAEDVNVNSVEQLKVALLRKKR